jgi:hypothetical protein
MHKASGRVAVRRASLRDLDTLVDHRRAMWDDMGIRDTAALQAHDRTYRTWAKERLRTRKLLGWIAESNGAGCKRMPLATTHPPHPQPQRNHHPIPTFNVHQTTTPRKRNRHPNPQPSNKMGNQKTIHTNQPPRQQKRQTPLPPIWIQEYSRDDIKTPLTMPLLATAQLVIHGSMTRLTYWMNFNRIAFTIRD